MITIRITPNGDVTTLNDDPLEAARAAFDNKTSVVRLAAPFLPQHQGMWVGYIDDFGAPDQPLNRRAWALYGRGAIYGDMFLALDSGEHIEYLDSLTAWLADPIEEWDGLTDEHLAYLTATPERPPMLARREDA